MRWTLLLGLLAACTVQAEESRRIASIRFHGNEVTRESVLLRELAIREGEAADESAIERSRQAIMDLGLFREVEVERSIAADGGLELDFHLREKRFLLPLPRFDTSAEEDFTFGGQLRWSNVAGLNHRADLVIEQGKYPNESQRERERETSARYAIPYFGHSDWGARVYLARFERVRPNATERYDETEDRFELLALRDYTHGRPRRGWRVGGGVLWERERNSGPFAPPASGSALAAVAVADFEDLRFQVYSETGARFSARLQGAARSFGSDYGYNRAEIEWFLSRSWGDGPHQTWHVVGAAGHRGGRRGPTDEFTLGGSSRLRGYDSEFLEGDRYWYGAFEILRPLGRDWLRGVALIEAGSTDDDRDGVRTGSPFVSVGLGVRMRATWFVDIEIELGLAYPLHGGDGMQVFAGRN